MLSCFCGLARAISLYLQLCCEPLVAPLDGSLVGPSGGEAGRHCGGGVKPQGTVGLEFALHSVLPAEHVPHGGGHVLELPRHKRDVKLAGFIIFV